MQVGASPAGIGRYIIELIQAFDECVDDSTGVEITAYTSASSHALITWKPSRVKVVAIGGAGDTKRRIFKQQYVLPGMINGSADIIHYPDYLTAVRNTVRAVVTIHDVAFASDPRFYTRPQRILRKVMHPVALRSAETIVVDSHFTRRELLRYFPGVDQDKVRVVYLGISPAQVSSEAVRAELRARLRLPDRFILSVCTREPRKNLDRLLHAFGRCPELSDEHLVLVGGAGWGQDSLAVIKEYGPTLARRVIVTGYVSEPELAALYHMTSAFVYISLHEGFGLPPLEALSHGVPVVASDIPVLHEVIGDNALFVDPHDIDHIGAGLRTALDSHDWRGKFARRGQQHVQRYTWRQCATEMLSIYGEAAARNGN